MNQRRKSLLDHSQNRAEEEWNKKKVLPLSKHRSLAGTGLLLNK